MAPGLDIDPAWFLRPDGQDASRTIHGVGHTARVRVHASEIAAALDLVTWEREALDYAALWHDIGRTNDGADYYHGAKSAGKVVGLGLHAGVDPRVLEVALFAVTHHCGDEPHAERAARWTDDPEATLRVFRALKDADGLDRVRLGDLDPAQLRNAFSRTRVARAQELLTEYFTAASPVAARFPGDIDRRSLAKLPLEQRSAIMRAHADSVSEEYNKGMDEEWLSADLGEWNAGDE